MTVATSRTSDSAAHRAVLEAFAQALGREVQNLSSRPDLLWQQLYNRLQWEEQPVPRVLAPELARRTALGAPPWMRTRTRFREAGALVRTLAGHNQPVDACAISPDGSFIVSVSGGYYWSSKDKAVRLWDVETGEERASLPLSGSVQCVALDPRRPFAACGGVGGDVYLIDLVGIEYGTIIVTAVDLGNRRVVHCPACLEYLPLEEAWLGQVIDCPRLGCDGHMRVNPFVVGRPRRRWWQFWRRR